MTKDKIRQLDNRVRQNMVANGQLTKQEVASAMAERDDLPDLADKCQLCETPEPQETVPAEESEDEEEGEDE